jgi:hypothetical protein
LFPELADPVGAHLDRFLVEHAVAALGALPCACPAQFGGEYPRVGTGMTQFIAVELVQVHVGHEPRTTADGRYRGSQDAKFFGRGRHQAAARLLNRIVDVTAASQLEGPGT